MTELGARLAALPPLPAPGRDAQVALVFDWESWWAIEERDHPTEIAYLAVLLEWYGALHARGVMVDIVPPEKVDDGYRLAIAPALYLLRDEGAAALTSFVEGGDAPRGPFTDIVDGHDQFRTGGFLSQLGPALGVRFEDFGALGAAPPAAAGSARRRRAVAEEATASRSASAPRTRGALSSRRRSRPFPQRSCRRSRMAPPQAGPRSRATAMEPERRGTSRRCPTLPVWMPSSAPWWRHPVSLPSFRICRRVSRWRAEASRHRHQSRDEPVEIFVEGTDAETGEPIGRRELAPQGVLFAFAPVGAAGGSAEPEINDDAVVVATP